MVVTMIEKKASIIVTIRRDEKVLIMFLSKVQKPMRTKKSLIGHLLDIWGVRRKYASIIKQKTMKMVMY